MYSANPGFCPRLHALRGLAALSVVFYHSKLMPPGIETDYLGVVGQLGAGVTLFFLLSGFSLALSNSRRTGHPDWMSGYMIRRLARILPVWYLFVAIHVVYHYFEFGKVYTLSEILLHVVPVFGLVPGAHESLVWAGWTIGVEVLFYLVFPLFLAMLGGSLRAWAVATLLATVVAVAFARSAPAGLPPSYAYMSIVHQLFVFLLGATLFFTAEHCIGTRGRRTARAVALVLGAGFTLWWTLAVLGLPWAQIGAVTLPVKAAALGCLVFAAYVTARRGTGPGRVLGFLGDHSYTIYLAHPIVIAETRRVYPGLRDAVGAASPDLAFLLYVAYVLFWTCLIAWIITRFVEAPVYRLGSAYARRVEDRRTSRSVAVPGQ